MDTDSDPDNPPMPMDNNPDNPPIPSPAGSTTKTNPIWTFFYKDSKQSCRCKHCNTTLKTPTGSTTSLRRHLERKHMTQFRKFLNLEKEYKDSNKPQTSQVKKCTQSILPYVRTDDKYGPSHPKSVAIKTEIAKFIVEGMHPYSIVDEPRFKNLINIADPKIPIPHSTTFSRTIVPDLYLTAVAKLKQDIAIEMPNLLSISLTTDFWTSLSTQSYLSVTLHFINNNFQLITRCLGCTYVSEAHTGETIANNLQTILIEWGLQHISTVYCITDNARNMKRGVEQTDMIHLLCFAHTLNLVIKDTKKECTGFETVMCKCRTIVGHFRHSSKAKSNLKARLQQLKIKQLELIQDVETRWNSEYLMMERLLLLKDALILELSQDECSVDNLTSSEWNMVSAYVKILKPIYDATVAISSEKKPTRCMIIPIIYGIENHINQIISSKELGTTLAKTLLKSLKNRFPLYMESHPEQECMFLDPRFKDHILPEEMKAEVRRTVKKMIVDWHTEQNELEASPTEEIPSPECAERKPEPLFAAFSVKPVTSTPSINKVELQAELELENYSSEPRIGIESDPLQWWQSHKHKYPLLVPLVRKYLGIPATEVPSERVFSTAGNIVTSQRSRLTTENAEKLIFLHENFKYMDI